MDKFARLPFAVYPRWTMKPTLYVGNQNYSSWSMRPWLVLKWGAIEHELRVIPLGGDGYAKRAMPSVLAVSPSGTVPSLHLGDGIVLNDSLAISEWAAEQAPAAELWPRDAKARAVARAAACEMHSGFAALRSKMPCNIRRRTEPRVPEGDVKRDVDRVVELWTELWTRWGAGGPYLFGTKPTIADAFYTPIATRFRTYGVSLTGVAGEYAATLLANPAFREWEAAGAAETWTMPMWDAV